MGGKTLLAWLIKLTVLQSSLKSEALVHRQRHEPLHALPRNLIAENTDTASSVSHVQLSTTTAEQVDVCARQIATTTVSLHFPLSSTTRASRPENSGRLLALAGEEEGQQEAFGVTETVVVTTTVVSSDTVQIPASLTDKLPQTVGTIHSTLDLEGRITSCPIIESPIPLPTSLIIDEESDTWTPAPITPPPQKVVTASTSLAAPSLSGASPFQNPPIAAIELSADSSATESLLGPASGSSFRPANSSTPWSFIATPSAISEPEPSDFTSLVPISPPATSPATTTESLSFSTNISINASASSLPPFVPPPEAEIIMPSGDIFTEPISNRPPSAKVAVRNDHPAEKKNVTSSPPIQTNKFFGNFLVGDQSAPTYVFPYSVTWAAGNGASRSFGMAISHIEAHQRVFGNRKPSGAAGYYLNPVGIQSLVLGARELGQDTLVATDSITAFSARVHLRPNNNAPPAVSFPLVQGMPFVTAQYAGATPLIQTGVFFRNVTRVTADPKRGVAKFNFILEDGSTWRIYAFATTGEQLDLQVLNNGVAQATRPFYGLIQVAKDPGNAEPLLDSGAGVFPTSLRLTGAVDNTLGSYTFTFEKEGHPEGRLIMYALPHHVSSFDGPTRNATTNIQLQTPTKGRATLVAADSWTMVEQRMPVDMTFMPWDPERGTVTNISDNARAMIHGIAVQEASQNMDQQSDLDSMYFSGKALAKFAILLVTINDLLGDRNLAQQALGPLKAAFDRFASNRQKYPLVYERVWGGLVSSGTYVTGDNGADFGNTFYNDHHFHYGYHVLAAACIAHLDPNWIPHNKDYVDLLIRDFANPSVKDEYFPQWRSFDWYHGHSWAHGLYASADGKDQESSSEDMMQAYAIKMWGMVTGDGAMAMRGNLMLAILSRSLQAYYLYKKDNQIQPAEFIGNKVAGILFENKIDHTTYFGANIEFIQGIHMIPLLPPSPYIRTKEFVKEEWDVYFSNGRVNEIQGGWKGIIFGNLATADPQRAWQFFNSSNFDSSWIDGGVTLTWYLAYAAAMGGI